MQGATGAIHASDEGYGRDCRGLSGPHGLGCGLCRRMHSDVWVNAKCSLGIQVGETTADGMFTLQPSECQGACADAPVLLVNDRTMCSFMSNEKLDDLIDTLQKSGGAA